MCGVLVCRLCGVSTKLFTSFLSGFYEHLTLYLCKCLYYVFIRLIYPTSVQENAGQYFIGEYWITVFVKISRLIQLYFSLSATLSES